ASGMSVFVLLRCIHSSIFRFVSVGVFFFQAEDGIRDRNVTGVQTCALPILYCLYLLLQLFLVPLRFLLIFLLFHLSFHLLFFLRSEERRVGKEGRSLRR